LSLLTGSEKQTAGNSARRDNGSPEYLAVQAMIKANGLSSSDGPVHGIIIDGIRNIGEVEFLRQFRGFFLVSVQADRDRRCKRSIASKGMTEEQFDEVNQREQNEHHRYGQHVNQCCYESDFVVDNSTEDDLSSRATVEIRELVNRKIISKLVDHVERLLANSPSRKEFLPTHDESLMTAAYVMSRMSSCLKRKVGAVVATDKGNVVSAGYNDIPDGQKSCLRDTDYQWCARDVLLEKMGKAIRYCPKCGTEVVVNHRCVHCNHEIKEFLRRCPECSQDPEVSTKCPNDECESDIFTDFLPGKKSAGKLLDVCRSLHAEENAVLNMVISGARNDRDLTLYTTTFPCNLCANKIVSVGIKEVVYCEPYITAESRKVLSGIKLRPFEGVKSDAYFRLHKA
jgi:deoxycytidylate deaminase